MSRGRGLWRGNNGGRAGAEWRGCWVRGWHSRACEAAARASLHKYRGWRPWRAHPALQPAEEAPPGRRPSRCPCLPCREHRPGSSPAPPRPPPPPTHQHTNTPLPPAACLEKLVAQVGEQHGQLAEGAAALVAQAARQQGLQQRPLGRAPALPLCGGPARRRGRGAALGGALQGSATRAGGTAARRAALPRAAALGVPSQGPGNGPPAVKPQLQGTPHPAGHSRHAAAGRPRQAGHSRRAWQGCERGM